MCPTPLNSAAVPSNLMVKNPFGFGSVMVLVFRNLLASEMIPRSWAHENLDMISLGWE